MCAGGVGTAARAQQICAAAAGAVVAVLAQRIARYLRGGAAKSSFPPLRREDMPKNPHALVERWWTEAKARDGPKALAVVLATCSVEEGATARYLQPHGIDEFGNILLGTNFESQKARHLRNDARCEIVWRDGDRQIRIRGMASVAGPGEAASRDAYANLSAGCRYGLTLLHQGQPIDEAQHHKLLARFDRDFCPDLQLLEAPDNYTALLLQPSMFEFYQGGHAGYINDRFLYMRKGDSFTLHSRLQA